MIIGRMIGWVLLLAGLLVLGRDLLVLGELWYAIHPASLQLLQPAIQRHIHPALWDWIVQPLLLGWAWAILVALGFALLTFFRRRERHRRRPR